MATTPTFVDITAETWTLVANAVTDGVVHIKTPHRHGYMHYYKVDGEGAPTAGDETLGIPFDGESAIISSDAAIDVYIWSWKEAGRVRVDL
jgi:hypothetical protein